MSRELKIKEEQLHLRIEASFLAEIRAKAKEKQIPFSRIVRKLLEMWLNGEIEIK
jgi:predicted DNA binding CopG/RHH family protein